MVDLLAPPLPAGESAQPGDRRSRRWGSDPRRPGMSRRSHVPRRRGGGSGPTRSWVDGRSDRRPRPGLSPDAGLGSRAVHQRGSAGLPAPAAGVGRPLALRHAAAAGEGPEHPRPSGRLGPGRRDRRPHPHARRAASAATRGHRRPGADRRLGPGAVRLAGQHPALRDPRQPGSPGRRGSSSWPAGRCPTGSSGPLWVGPPTPTAC